MHLITLLHVVAGSVALIVAPAALLVPKGKGWHRRWGIAFSWAMVFVLCSAAFMWQAKGHVFLVPLGLVSAYLIFSGWRSIARRRRGYREGGANLALDLGAAVLTTACGLTLLAMAATAASPLMHALVPVLVGLGMISLAFALNDVLGFASPRLKMGWLLSHLSGMIAAYISAITAFIVINAHGVPMTIRWAVPCTLGGATIIWFALRTRANALASAKRASGEQPRASAGGAGPVTGRRPTQLKTPRQPTA
ncbi:MAG: hypothetical protein ACLPYS_11850 [Vulcanimicrobiaceae bacterium]